MKKEGLVIWLTGLPCSGKTTLSKKIEKYFVSRNLPIQRLDGDVVRTTISKDLGFSKKDRDENIERISYVASMLSQNGVNVVVAFVSPYIKMREFSKNICGHENFVEVYVKCSLEECKKRDVKGMYAKAIKGEIKDFTGIDDPYEEPTDPGIVLETENEDISTSFEKMIEFLENNLVHGTK